MLGGLWVAAMAATWVEVVDGPISADEHDQLLERAAGSAPADVDNVELWVRLGDGQIVPAEQQLPKVTPVEEKEPPPPPSNPVDHPGQTQGVLSGRAVYVSQCHGWLYSTRWETFLTQRNNLYDTVEDFHNPEGANQFLVRYLENAGASVFTVRERGLTDEMVVVDDLDGGYTEHGTTFGDGPSGYIDDPPWEWAEDPFDFGTTRTFAADGGDRVSWVVDVAVAGEYPVYVSWRSSQQHASDAHYRITHPGGVIDRYFDQRVHGSTWQYVETLYLPAGVSQLQVELLGDSADVGATLSADAVRIGGGLGDVVRGGVTTERPRWEDGGILGVQWNSAPVSVYDPEYTGNGSDPSSRSRWAAWEHPAGEDAVYVSWHSNAGGGTGTSTYTYEGRAGPAATGSVALADLLQEEIVGSVRMLWDSEWVDRGHRTAPFSEVNPSNNDEMPAALIELAFHDHPYDVELLKDPAFRRDASRAMLRAIVRYFAERDGVAAVFPPEPPRAVSVRNQSDGRLVASWEDGLVGDPFGDAPTSWLVQTSEDGLTWGSGFECFEREVALPVAVGDTVYVRISARNEAGVSFPSEVMGGRRSPDGSAPVLVVPAFDRLETSLLPWEDVGGSVGWVRRGNLRFVNRFDGVVAHGDAVSALGWYWESAADEVLPALAPQDWSVLMWVAGEESTRNDSFDSSQQDWVRSHLDAGGALFSSGSEVLWDLAHLGDASDQTFAAEVLGASMAADDSESVEVSGEGLWDGLQLNFGAGHGDVIQVEYPDVLQTEREPLARYASGGVAAAYGDNVVHMGFPFETIGDRDARHAAVAAILPVLDPDYTPPTIDHGEDDTGGGTPPDDAPPPPAGNEKERKRGCSCGSAMGTASALLPLWLIGLVVARRRVA